MLLALIGYTVINFREMDNIQQSMHNSAQSDACVVYVLYRA